MFKKITLAAIIAFSIILLWCWNWWKIIQSWNKVTLTYSANFEDWSIFNTGETVTITLWSWNIIKWIEDWIIGLKKWDKKEIFIIPEYGYGKQYNPLKVQQIAKIIIDRNIKINKTNPEIWKLYKIWDIEGIIKSKEWKWDFQYFMLDINPRNTYENLIFKVKIDKIYR